MLKALLLLFFTLQSAFAAPVLHLIRPDSTFAQITTLDACMLMRGHSDAGSCNPALYKTEKKQGIGFGLATISDGDSVEVGKKLIFKPIEEEFLRELFEEKSFNTWGANTSIDFKTSLFHLYYDPVTVTADVLVLNPAFPEVSMALVKSKRVGVTMAHELLSSDEQALSIGVNAFHYQRKEYLDSFSLVDLTSSDVDELIKFKTRSGSAADVGLAYQNQSSWVPDVSFLVKNLNSDFKTNDSRLESERYLWPVLVYETHSRLAVGKTISTEYGALGFEVNAPFKGVYEDFYNEFLTLGAHYHMRSLEWLVGLAKYQQTTGFRFSAKSVAVGVFYARTRPLGDFRKDVENSAGVQLGVSL
jgi:hypothetical protein